MIYKLSLVHGRNLSDDHVIPIADNLLAPMGIRIHHHLKQPQGLWSLESTNSQLSGTSEQTTGHWNNILVTLVHLSESNDAVNSKIVIHPTCQVFSQCGESWNSICITLHTVRDVRDRTLSNSALAWVLFLYTDVWCKHRVRGIVMYVADIGRPFTVLTLLIGGCCMMVLITMYWCFVMLQ